jgi:hypothetical protein
MKLSACRRLSVQPLDAVWYRAILAKHWQNALATSHTSRVTTRFNPGTVANPTFEVLYLTERPVVAQYEVNDIFGPPELALFKEEKSRYLLIDVSVRLQRVADLTDPSQQALLETSVQELTGNWDVVYPAGDAPTQKLGMALFASKRLEGFLTISAKVPRCKNLVVFPQKLLRGSELRFDDPISGQVRVIPP